MKNKFLLLCFVVLSAACNEAKSPEQVAGRFLAGYLDCRFSDVASLASPIVQEQMRWRASQLTQAEVEMMEGGKATGVDVIDVEEYADSCIVVLRASDALLLDSIGQPGHIGEALYRVTLKKEKGSNWKVAALACEL